jgi:outer membrane receptor protein involved in Fe transport
MRTRLDTVPTTVLGNALLVALVLAMPADGAERPIDEIIVTSTRAPTALADHAGNIDALDAGEIEAAAHVHIHELLTRIPGVWVTRASGQESLPSIRSPVLTGAGSCGAFLTLEDGIPSRPSGFCNVNQLFELPTELAERIEIVRGPGNALYGSNAVHGTINVLLPRPERDGSTSAGLELGSNDFVRVQGLLRTGGDAPSVLGAVLADDGGFRDDSGYRQIKGLFKKALPVTKGDLVVSLSVSDLDQDTAGFIIGEDAYKDEELSRDNPNPEAFREANSQRLSLVWNRPYPGYTLDVRPYLRRSEMTFLQHFLPGQPLEENGHVSVGVLSNARFETGERAVALGFDAEVADVYLRQTQFGPTEGSDFLRETRPEGKHYDYDVLGVSIAAYVQAEAQVSPKLMINGGLRAEYTYYDYSNNMLAGNTRDDGTPCGLGGCLYTRPADRSDDYLNLAPKIGLAYRLSDRGTLYATLGRGFRAPQMTELYRLQSGQAVSDLDPETIDSAEIGVRVARDRWFVDSSIFTMRKKNSVIRDAEGFNVSDARSQHAGIELSYDVALNDHWNVVLNGSYAKHTYDFDLVAARGETFVSGRDIDTAPHWIGSAQIRYDGSGRLGGELQWVSLGSYYLDAENRYTYPGHDIANIRLTWALTDRWSIDARVNNVTDDRYADRADFAFGNFRYFPGRGREYYLRVHYAD